MAQIHRSVQYRICRRYGGYQGACVSVCVCVWDEQRGTRTIGMCSFMAALSRRPLVASPRLADASV